MNDVLKSIVIHEVGLRDGLQVEPVIVPAKKKIEWLQKLIDAGIRHIQVGSFVHPKLVPQMADVDDLFQIIRKTIQLPNNVVLSGLVLNERGLERAFEAKADKILMGVSASETHSMKNTKMTVKESTNRITAMAKSCIKNNIPVQVSVQSSFGCGYEGKVPQENVMSIIEKYFESGINNISLADTAGHAIPCDVESLFGKILDLNPNVELSCHFHNTFGFGMLNIVAAAKMGVKYIETSFGGLGGCPFTKIPAGNVATEDLVHYLQRMGFMNQINLQKLIALVKDLSSFLGKELTGYVYKIGQINWNY
ncbi:MAG: hypothetical protein A2X64_00805 [Ignavibacteria bacterium GWF2_33_9]|nr:MAG: hypothetical protein A2X64_00805 [Ignavibacteria bacterium GWF2_33_9]